MCPGTWVRKAGVSVQLCMWSKVPWKILFPEFSWRSCLQTGHHCRKCCILDGGACLVCVALVWRHNQAGTMIQCPPQPHTGFWAEQNHLGFSHCHSLPWLSWDISLSTWLLWCQQQFLGGEAALNSGWITIFLWLMAQGSAQGKTGLWWTPLTLWVTSLNC